MTDSDANAREYVAVYLAANLAMRKAIKQNERDFDAAVSNNFTLVYFADSNVVQWYLRPVEDQDLTLFTGRNQDRALEVLSGLVTADWIFSGGLPGARGEPLLLTPSHAEELNRSMHDNYRKLSESRVPPDSTRIGQFTGDFREKIAAFSAAKKPSEAQFNGLFTSFSDLVQNEQRAELAFYAGRVRRLLENDLVRQVAYYGDFGIKDAESILARDSEKWREHLLEAGKDPKNDRNLEHDVKSLSLLSYLNEDALSEGRKIRYLLISSDYSVHSAVDAWRSKTGFNGIPQFDFMRHPRQFTPILNFNSMRGSAVDAQGLGFFDNIKQLVSDISFSFSGDRISVQSNQHFPEKTRVELQRILDRETTDTFKKDVVRLSKEWRLAMKSALLLNSAAVVRVADEKLWETIQPLTEAGLEDQLSRYFDKSIEKLASQHIMFASGQQILAHLRELKRNLVLERDQSLTRYNRSPSLVLLALPQALRRFGRDHDWPEFDTLSEFVDRLVASKDLQTLEAIELVVPKLGPEDACDLAALLAFRFGDWSQAAYLAERRMLDASNSHDEYQYLSIVAERFQGPSLDRLQRNRSMIRRQVMRWRRESSPFVEARALAELAAQELFFAFDQALPGSKSRRVPDHYIAALVSSAKGALLYSESIAFSSSKLLAPPALIDRLKHHIVTNLISVDLFERLAPLGPGFSSIVQSDDAFSRRLVDQYEKLDKANSLKSEPRFRLGEFYALCLRKLLGDRHWSNANATRLKALRRDFELASERFLSMDRREVEWLEEKLAL